MPVLRPSQLESFYPQISTHYVQNDSIYVKENPLALGKKAEKDLSGELPTSEIQTDQPTHEVSISLPRGCKLFVGDGRVFCLLACCLGVLWLLQFLLVKYTTTIKKKTDCYSMTSKKLLSPLQITFERILHFISCQSNSLSNTLKIQEATS